jgi:hypothetical protein
MDAPLTHAEELSRRTLTLGNVVTSQKAGTHRLSAVNARKCRYFVEYPKSSARDPFGWLGHQDSNLGMAKSKVPLLLRRKWGEP